jgi:hypothetical protein
MRRFLGAAACTLSLAAVVAGSSVTAASASTTTARTEHFQFVSVSTSSNRDSAIAWGAFTAGGTINLNSGHVRLPGGTFRAIHHRTSMRAELNRKTCLFVSVGHGTYKLGHGTGRYRHISGRGTYTSRVWAVFARNARGQCSQSKRPSAFQEIVNARGPVGGLSGIRMPARWGTLRRAARRAG